MRTMRLSVAGAVVLALLGGMGGVAAQSEAADATATFNPAGSLMEARFFHTATPLSDRRTLVVGGAGEGALLSSAEVWDPETMTFRPAGSLTEARAGHTATPLPDGRVLVVGGTDYAEEPIALVEVWDPETETFRPMGSLVEARSRHTASRLPDGLLATAEIREPAE